LGQGSTAAKSSVFSTDVRRDENPIRCGRKGGRREERGKEGEREKERKGRKEGREGGKKKKDLRM
jgi:hypothetical protein